MKTQHPLSPSAVVAKTVISCLMMIMCLGNSCKKDGNLVQATVEDGGKEEVDGCGWLIKVDQKTFYPVNLSAAFRQDGKKIRIRYKALDENQICGFAVASNQKIEILEIKNN